MPAAATAGSGELTRVRKGESGAQEGGGTVGVGAVDSSWASLQRLHKGSDGQGITHVVSHPWADTGGGHPRVQEQVTGWTHHGVRVPQWDWLCRARTHLKTALWSARSWGRLHTV